MENKRCLQCDISKPISEFIRNRAREDGLSGYCRECHNAFCSDQRKRQRQAMIDALGGKCVRCGFDDWRALQVDHIHGGGAEARRNGDWPHFASFRAKVRANPEDFQLLCANCNQIKKFENAKCKGKAMRKAWVTRRKCKGITFHKGDTVDITTTVTI